LNPDTVFSRLDTNRDGMLDQGELDELLARRFKTMDANADGQVGRNERQRKRGRMQD
jgi:Ca2+-binding EF-hand superfamily protein